MTSLRVLMCDNDAEVGAFVRRVAEGLHHEMKFIAEPADFGGLYRSFNPDLVILDLAMPRIDGVELLRLLAEERCQASVLLMSGMGPDMGDAALRLGHAYCLNMAGIVAKPVRASALREVLSTLRTPARCTGSSGALITAPADPSGRGNDIHLPKK